MDLPRRTTKILVPSAASGADFQIAVNGVPRTYRDVRDSDRGGALPTAAPAGREDHHHRSAGLLTGHCTKSPAPARLATQAIGFGDLICRPINVRDWRRKPPLRLRATEARHLLVLDQVPPHAALWRLATSSPWGPMFWACHLPMMTLVVGRRRRRPLAGAAGSAPRPRSPWRTTPRRRQRGRSRG